MWCKAGRVGPPFAAFRVAVAGRVCLASVARGCGTVCGRSSDAMAKVLVVEDDADSLEIVGKTLEKGGHVVVPAANGWEGLLALDAHHIDIIVLDLMMPGMNGNAFLRIIRNDQRRKF